MLARANAAKQANTQRSIAGQSRWTGCESRPKLQSVALAPEPDLMHPILLHIGTLPIQGYAVFVALAALVAFRIRRSELARLGWQADPRQRRLALAALVGAVLGSKLGVALFPALGDPRAFWLRMLDIDFTGKTVVGALAGGFVAVEIAKRRLGIRHRTGDAWAVALPAGQGIGRLGCLLHGCCAGVPSAVPWAVTISGITRHPAPLYESVLDFALAAVLWSIRKQPRPLGHLFRFYLIGYATIRLSLDGLRVDSQPALGPLSWVQLGCLLAMAGFGVQLLRERGQNLCPTPNAP